MEEEAWNNINNIADKIRILLLRVHHSMGIHQVRQDPPVINNEEQGETKILKHYHFRHLGPTYLLMEIPIQSRGYCLLCLALWRTA